VRTFAPQARRNPRSTTCAPPRSAILSQVTWDTWSTRWS